MLFLGFRTARQQIHLTHQLLKSLNLLKMKAQTKKILFFIVATIMLLVTIYSALAIRINEVMYNPEADDNNKEFVEIYNEEWVNLSDYTINDSTSSDKLELIKSYNSSYSLIVEEGFNHTGINASIYSIGATIGNGLSNTADSISIIFNNTVIDHMNYSNSAKEGYSLEYLNGTFRQSTLLGGSPGYDNNFIANNLTEINATEENLTTNNSNSIENSNETEIYNSTEDYILENDTEINSIVEDNEEEIDEPANETKATNTTAINTTANNTDKEFFYIEIDKLIFLEGEKVKFKHNTKLKDFAIEYWIEDLFGNIIKNKLNTTNLNAKSFTPKLKNDVWVFVIKSIIRTNSSSYYNETMFIVKKENQSNDNLAVNSNAKNKSNEVSSKCSCDSKDNSSTNKSKEKSKLVYSILDLPQKTSVSGKLSFKLMIKGDDKEHKIKAWSYIYKGNRIFNTDESNVKEFAIGKQGTTKIELNNKLQEMIPGKYYAKIIVFVDGNEEKELEESFEIIEDLSKNSVSNLSKTIETKNQISNKENQQDAKKTPAYEDKEDVNPVYSSKSAISSDLVVYFLIGLFVVVVAIVISFK